MNEGREMDAGTGEGVAGGATGAIIASICCIAPLILLIAGIGVTAGLVMSQYRPYFLLAGAAFVGLYIFIRLRKKARTCSCSYREMLGRESGFITTTLFAFLAGLLVINFVAIPLLGGAIAQGEPAATHSAELRGVELEITGMSCSGCATTIRELLMNKAGVVRAEISYEDGTGKVIFDPAIISVDEIIQTIKPYEAKMISEWEVKGNV